MKKPLFIETPLSELKASLSGVRKKQFKRLYDEGERRIRQSLSVEPPKMSTTFMGITIMNLALLYLLTEEERYLEHAKRWMLTVVGYKDWGYSYLVNVDLSASWILFGLGLAYDWLKDDLTPEEREKVFEKLVLQANIMYDHKVATAGQGWSTQYFQNHNWINMTGLAAAGYALLPEYPEAQKFIDISKENFEKVYAYLADDGSNYEGAAYWRYGGMWLFVYAHLLRSAEGIDYFQTCSYLKNTFYFRLYQSTGNLLHPLNFGDCHDYYSSHVPAVYYKYASEYRDGYAQALAELVLDKYLYQEALESHVKPGILFEAGLEFLWFDPTVAARDIRELPKTRYFPDLGLLYFRDSWDEDATVFSIKCSAPGGNKQWEIGWDHYRRFKHKVMSLSHHHPDNLSYILNRKNVPLLVDEGYNREIMPWHHNSVLVDWKIYDVEGKSDAYMHSAYQRLSEDPEADLVEGFRGEVGFVEADERLFIYKGDNAKIYRRDLEMTEASRTVLSNNLEYLLVIDRLVSSLPHRYTLVNNTYAPPKLEGNKARYGIGLNEMEIEFFSDRKIAFTTSEFHISTIFTPQEPDIVKKEEFKSFRAESEEAESCVFIQIVKYGDSGKLPAIETRNNSTAEMLALEITGGEWTDRYYEGKIDDGFVKTDGSNLYLRFQNGVLKDVILIGATFLEVDGKLVFEAKNRKNLLRSKEPCNT